MATVFNQTSSLSDVMDFLDINSLACQEAKDYCRSLGNITMGEFMTTIANNPVDFKPSWIAWCVMSFPQLMTPDLNAAFETELNRYPDQVKIVAFTRNRKEKGKVMELVNNA